MLGWLGLVLGMLGRVLGSVEGLCTDGFSTGRVEGMAGRVLGVVGRVVGRVLGRLKDEPVVGLRDEPELGRLKLELLPPPRDMPPELRSRPPPRAIASGAARTHPNRRAMKKFFCFMMR